MNNLGVESKIFYFNEEGRVNLEKTIDLVVNRAQEADIKKVLVFTADGDGAFLLKEKVTSDMDIEIIAVSFPNNQPFFIKDENGESQPIIPKTSSKEVKERLGEQGITLIQGVMPLQDIIVPGVKDSKIEIINQTLALISGGLDLCIQAVLMATDSGYVDPGEKVITMSADTALISTGTISKYLFHPQKGMQISEIICKPRGFTISRG